MRINDRASKYIDRAPAPTAPSAAKAASEASAGNASKKSAAAGASVNVSARAQELAAGASRLEELRAQVRDGTYKIDPQKIAARIVGGADDE